MVTETQEQRLLHSKQLTDTGRCSQGPSSESVEEAEREPGWVFLMHVLWIALVLYLILLRWVMRPLPTNATKQPCRFSTEDIQAT